MSNEFYTILTDVGLAAIANASVSSSTVNFTKMQVGDGNGAYYTPTKDMTALRNKTWEGPVASVEIDPNNPNWVSVEAVVPATDGGFYIREIGITNDDGVLLAIGKLPETYKPALDSGSTKDLYLRAIFEVSNASVINLRTDPSVVLASKKFVEDKVAVVSGDMTSLRNQITSHLEQKASLNAYGHVQHATLEVLLSITWDGTSAPYTQSVTVNGIMETDNPIISPVYSEDNETAIAQKEAWSMVSKAKTVNNGIRFYCFEDKPIVPIQVQIKVVR